MNPQPGVLWPRHSRPLERAGASSTRAARAARRGARRAALAMACVAWASRQVACAAAGGTAAAAAARVAACSGAGRRAWGVAGVCFARFAWGITVAALQRAAARRVVAQPHADTQAVKRIYDALDALSVVGSALSVGEAVAAALLTAAAATCSGARGLSWAAVALAWVAFAAWAGRGALSWRRLLRGGGEDAWSAHMHQSIRAFHRRTLWAAALFACDGPLPVDVGAAASKAADAPAALLVPVRSTGLNVRWLVWAMAKNERAARGNCGDEMCGDHAGSTRGQRPGADELRRIARALHFSVAAYTGPTLDFGRAAACLPPIGPMALWAYRQGACTPWRWGRTQAVRGDNMIGGHGTAWRAYLSRGGVGGELLHARLPQRGAPASEHSHFFLHADDEKRELVLAVRGTSRVLDCVMDASMRPVKWSDGMYTHGWAAALADGILKELRGGEMLDVMLREGGRCPGYALTLTGHSLGAAVATLLTLKLRAYLGESVRVLCVAISPMPCLNASAARTAGVDCMVTSVVYNNEVVPYLSMAHCARLIAAASSGAAKGDGTPLADCPGVARGQCFSTCAGLGLQCACGSCRGSGAAWARHDAWAGTTSDVLVQAQSTSGQSQASTAPMGTDEGEGLGAEDDAPRELVAPQAPPAPREPELSQISVGAGEAIIAIDVDVPPATRAERCAAGASAVCELVEDLYIPGRVVHVRRDGARWGGKHIAEVVELGGLDQRWRELRPLRPRALVDHVPMRLEAACRELLAEL